MQGLFPLPLKRRALLGAEKLAAALPSLTSLENLTLEGNSIGDLGARLLVFQFHPIRAQINRDKAALLCKCF